MAGDDCDPDAAHHAGSLRRDRLLAWPKVRELYGISRTTAWRLQKVGEFPQPVHISSGRVGWRESELILWAASRTPRDGPRPPSPDRADRSTEPLAPARALDVVAGPETRHRAGRRHAGTLDGQTAFEF